MCKNKNDLAKSGYMAFAGSYPFLRGNTAQGTCTLDEMVNHRALVSSPRPSLRDRPEAARHWAQCLVQTVAALRLP